VKEVLVLVAIAAAIARRIRVTVARLDKRAGRGHGETRNDLFLQYRCGYVDRQFLVLVQQLYEPTTAGMRRLVHCAQHLRSNQQLKWNL